MTSAGPGCSRPPHCAQDPSPAPASPQQELQGGQRPKLSLLSPSRAEGALPASAPRGRGPSAALALQSPGPMKPPVPVAPGTFLNQLFSQCPEALTGKGLALQLSTGGCAMQKKQNLPRLLWGPAYCPNPGCTSAARGHLQPTPRRGISGNRVELG